MAFYPIINQAGVFAGQTAPGAAADAVYTAPRKIRRGQRLAEFLAQRAMLTQPDSGLEAAGAIAQQLAGAYLHNRADRLGERNAQLRRDTLAAASAEPDPLKRAEILRRSPDPELRALAEYQSGESYSRRRP